MMNKILVIIIMIVVLCGNTISASTTIPSSNQYDVVRNELKHYIDKEEKNAREIQNLKRMVNEQKEYIDSLRSACNANSIRIGKNEEKISNGLASTRKTIDNNVNELNSTITVKTLLAGLVGLLAVALVTIAIFFFRKKYSKNYHVIEGFKEQVDKINAEQSKLNDAMAQTDSKLLDTIDKQLSIESQKIKHESSQSIDHSLAIAIANEMARIQQNLNHMDEHVKGVSQLKNRAKAIITTLKSKQYDIPELIGKTYHEGDNMIATMEYNEDLEAGVSRIKRVIKPQVSYAGKIIQQAEVVVEYNE